ncbi:MAG TPA: site-specific integrase [Ktedonobacteraceae bacterium]|nr:site-specific integrase [Ktedonobacteraceae bacterium]
MALTPGITLTLPLTLPVRVRFVDGEPKLMAGGVPLTPINLALQDRQLHEGATRVSIDTYLRAARLYAEFCAHRHQSLIGITNEEFKWFVDALIGQPFPNAQGTQVQLPGKRGKRTADLMITLLYSLTADITDRYGVSFDWRRYKGIPNHLVSTVRNFANPSRSRSWHFPRSHRFKWATRRAVGIPDDQFVHLLRAANDRWGQEIADGDIACAEEPEMQRGALFYRNLAILMVLRCAGSRRSEVVELRFEDIDRKNSLIYLTTKGHRAEGGGRLPVLMVPWVEKIIWHYATHYRPIPSDTAPEHQQYVFLSHSVRNYGEKLGGESVRAMLNTLRPALTSPWNKLLTPHKLRHSFGYDLQKLVGPGGIVSNMRHASIRSIDPYIASSEAFADQIVAPENEKFAHLLKRAGLLERFHD